MPYRASSIALGLLGLVAIVALIVVGADLVRHARQGAAWKKRLVGAGLMLLASLGLIPAAVSGCAKKDSPSEPKEPTSKPSRVAPGPMVGERPAVHRRPAGTLPADPWKRIAVITSEARAIIQGKRGAYPFDKAGKKRLLENLELARAAVDTLQKQGRLNAGEAGLWKADLAAMRVKLGQFRTKDRARVSCYEPRPMPRPGQLSLRRMRTRLAFLEKLAAAKQLHPRVVHKVLVQIEADVAILASPTATVGMNAADRKLAQKIAQEAPAYIKAIRARLGVAIPSTTGLEKTPQWEAVVEGWKAIAPLAANSAGSTRAQRAKALKEMARATQAISTLRSAGRLDESEASLLDLEAARLRTAMSADRPKDANVKCYKMKHIQPARASYSRMNARLKALQAVVKQGKITRVVLARVLPAIEADLRVLGDPKQVKELTGPDRAAAISMHKKVQALVARIKQLPTR